MPLVVCWCRCWGIPVSQKHGCRTLLLFGSCWWDILAGQKKLGCGLRLVVCWCCCWGIPVSQEHGCRTLLPIGSYWWQILFGQKKIRLRNAACGPLVLQLGNPGWPGKTRLENVTCRWLLLLGILDSLETAAERCCWLVAAWWESWLVRKKLGCGMPLVVRWCCCWGI